MRRLHVNLPMDSGLLCEKMTENVNVRCQAFYIFSLCSQVDRQSQFIQGYRVLYRQSSGMSSPGPWLSQDVKVSSERAVVLSSLKKGIVYEMKVRPYFNEFQGTDSESKTARTTEERKMMGMCTVL